MIKILEKDLQDLKHQNVENISNQFLRMKKTYNGEKVEPLEKQEEELNPEVRKESHLKEDYAVVDLNFIDDLKLNQEWYDENINEILFNVGYPARMQTELLKHIEC